MELQIRNALHAETGRSPSLLKSDWPFCGLMRSERPVSSELLSTLIREVRGQRVMLDRDLAELYGVETRVLNQAVSRNSERFPEDFVFRLTSAEWSRLRSQFVISKTRGGRRHCPRAFTEQGVAMLSSVLRSRRAVQTNIAIMRTFVQLRRILAADADLARKLAALERKYDRRFKVVFDAIRQLMTPTARSRRKIGYQTDD